MKHLIFLPFESNFIVPNRLFVTLENANILADKSEDVFLIYCDGVPDNMCWINTHCDKKMCKLCNRYRKNMFVGLNKKVKTLPIASFFHKTLKDYSDLTFEYESNEDIKKLTYNHVSIGYAALSSYITPTRNLYPLLDQEFRSYFDILLKTQVIMTDVVNTALDLFKPDEVGIFNTRFTVSKPIFDTCLHRKTEVTVYETTGNFLNGRQLTHFKNCASQDVSNSTKLVSKMWLESSLPEEEKIKIGSQFFIDRRGAIPAGDKVYISAQKEGLLPDNWDSNKHNIVIFNSSEDENVSLGEEFDHNLFPSQYQGIKTIFEHFKDYKDYHFYLRIHPNLKNINYNYHVKLFDLEKIGDNITIIPGNSPISTYALMDAAEKIIVFGSTTGYEAVYWNKPVISLCLCEYSLLDICYSPSTVNELDELIKQDLKPKDKLPAIKLAYYHMNKERPNFKYYEYIIKHHHFFGKKVDIYKWKNKEHWWAKNTCVLIQLIGAIYRQIKYPRPVKENPNAAL